MPRPRKTILIGHPDVGDGAAFEVIEEDTLYQFVSLSAAIALEINQDSDTSADMEKLFGISGRRVSVEIHWQSTPEDEMRLWPHRMRVQERNRTDQRSEADGWMRRPGGLMRRLEKGEE